MSDDNRRGIRSDRRYPSRPIVGVGAVIVTDAGAVVLVRRKYEPLQRRWTLPGGMLELGESLRAAVAREVFEETGLSVDVGPIVDVIDHVDTDAEGRTAYHFVIADYLCRPRAGTVQAGTDVDAVRLADPAALSEYALRDQALGVIRRALELYTATGRSS